MSSMDDIVKTACEQMNVFGHGPTLPPGEVTFAEITDENGTMVCVIVNGEPFMCCHPDQLQLYLKERGE